MTTFEIGPGLSCDLDLLIASRLLIQASSGQGKTRTVRRILEQTHGKVQHLVIDPEGEYATLREKFDYVLAAPKGGDVVAHPRYAKVLAEELLKLGVSAILDIYELNPDDRRLFVKNFLMALVDAPRELWHPALVVLDEAHIFCPEKGEAVSALAVEAISTRGRKRGFCLIAATQRLAKFKKDAAAELANKLIGGTNLDIDIDRAGEELGIPKPLRVGHLRALEPGRFYAIGRAFSTDSGERLTSLINVKVGKVITSHPEPGESAAPVPPPTAKVRKILEHLATLPAEAEEREKSFETLKRENQQLRSAVAIAKRGWNVDQQPKVERVEVPVLREDERRVLTEAMVDLNTVARGISALERWTDAWRGIERRLDAILAQKIGSGRAAVVEPRRTPSGIRAPRRDVLVTPAASSASDPSLGKSGKRRMLVALAQRPQGLTRAQLGVRSRVSSKGGSFDTYLSALRQSGYVDTGGERITITQAGVDALGAYEPLPEGQALADHYIAEFGNSGAARMLRVAVEAYPKRIPRHELGEMSGVSAAGGSFDTYVSKLRTLELVDVSKEGVKASDEFFE